MSAGGGTERRFALVSWSGARPLHLSPRGQRTAAHLRALAELGEVERVGPGKISSLIRGDTARRQAAPLRRAVREAMATTLIDKYEPAAWRALRSWRPDVAAAVLIGYPMSPLPLAARRLAERDIPYVVDLGDPWLLTNPYPTGGRLRRERARRQERRLWEGASAVIVTTAAQGEALRELFPHLGVLVRPNGFNPAASAAGAAAPPPRDPDELRLVHYGSLYGRRVDFGAVLARLQAGGRRRQVTLVHYGGDWDDVLAAVPPGVRLERRSPIAWEEVMAGAGEFDAALVIGWADRAKLPSKAIQYLTLPIPRIALANPGGDALGAYVADKPGWATVVDDEADPAGAVEDLLAHEWTDEGLRPPASESWESVTRTLGDFVAAATGSVDPPRSRRDGAASAAPAVAATGTR